MLFFYVGFTGKGTFISRFFAAVQGPKLNKYLKYYSAKFWDNLMEIHNFNSYFQHTKFDHHVNACCQSDQ